MSDIKIGLIGVGASGGTSRGLHLARLCETLGHGKIAAIFDIDKAKAENAASEIEGCKGFGTYEEFAESGINTVVVGSPIQVHAKQSIESLDRGLNVLCEVVACATMEEAMDLCEAANRSSAKYMFAENYCYLDEVEFAKRLYDSGKLGKAIYGEGEYIHCVRELAFDADGNLTWRGEGWGPYQSGCYCTHSLGPLLYFLDEPVVSVSCQATDDFEVVPGRYRITNHNMLMKTRSGAVLRVRVDWTSPRPHRASFYCLQGTKGIYEASSGKGDPSGVWFEDQGNLDWVNVQELMQEYIPDRLNLDVGDVVLGHGSSEYWMLKDFFASILEDKTPAIDVFKGLDYTVPGILAEESFKRGGEAICVPDFRKTCKCCE